MNKSSPHPQDTEELKPCPLCCAVLSQYTTRRTQEQFWRHPLSGCPLSRFIVAPENITAWNRGVPDSPVTVMREALEKIAGGTVTCANGDVIPMTKFRQSEIAKAALAKLSQGSVDDE